MAIINPDNKIRNVKLTGDEIEIIIEELNRSPHNFYKIMGFEKIIKRLKDAQVGEKEE